MRTKTLYRFDELPEEAREKAIENMRDDGANTNHDWWEASYQYWKDELDKLGFTDADISFRGFWSQGDGASFTAGIDGGQYIKASKQGKRFRSLLNILQHGWSVYGKVYRTHPMYCHEYTVSVSMESDYYNRDNVEVENRVYAQLQELEASVLEDVRELSRKIYRALEEEYYFRTSDKEIEEYALANPWTYEFDEQGNLECER